MYTISNRLKIFSIILMVAGAGLWGWSYMKSHNTTVEDVKVMLAEEAASDHGGGHSEAADSHATTDDHDDSHESAAGDHEGEEAHHEDEHAEHVMHQIHNRPYAALYVAAFFFMMIALGTLAFYAVQRASQAGWSPVLFRVMEAITYYLLPGAIIVVAIALWAGDHLFIWMDPEVVAEDKLIQNKSGFLNKTGFIIRAAIFIGGWSL